MLPSPEWRLDALRVLQRASMWEEGRALNTADRSEREDMLRDIIVRLRARGWSRDPEIVRDLETIAAVNGILVPPAHGECWRLPKAHATTGGEQIAAD